MSIAQEIMSYFGIATRKNDEQALEHYGMPRRSGRYPWGSGDDPYQHGSSDFLSRVDALKKNGWEETPENIMKEFGLTTTQYRTEKSNALDERKMFQRAQIKSMKEDGKGWTEIGRALNLPESTVRSMMNEASEKRNSQARNLADQLKSIVDEKGMIDVGTGTEINLGVSKEKLKQALKLLEEDGYPTYSGGMDQVTNKGKRITQTVLCPPGSEHKDIYNLDKVHSLEEYVSRDGENILEKFQYPSSIDPKRVKIRYADEAGPDGITGIQKDGIIELRRGVEDLSLGDSRYSQVRIMVNGTHYLKGMAVYSDDLPEGVDIVFNTNKTPDKPMIDTTSSKMDKCVLKPIKNDPDNPFGSLIKSQSYYDDPNGKFTDPITGKKQSLSLINKRADEGDWSEWADALPSQFLSKQTLPMAKKQLDLAKADKLAEYDEICSITNPTIKKYWLNKFASECDSAAVHLKAAALPGQKYHVIIPVNTLKDDEIYAPGYPEGSKLALVRYPHGGTFEIPVCTVTHKNALGKKIIGTDSIDAVGINSKVAERLSGADFDGDTAMCIPTHDRNGKVKITSTKPLEGLKDFDPKTKYPERPGMKYMKDPKTGKDATQCEMGKISNLITDMTLGGANPDELAAAVRHSMVVIDAGKHKLDYKQSEVDNNIKALKNKYQRRVDPETGEIKVGGASTLISRASGEQSVLKRQGSSWVNLKSNEGKKSRDGIDLYDPKKPEGSLIYKVADDVSYETTVVNKRTGAISTKTIYKYQKSTKMAETDDAYSLISEGKHPMEIVYANYANDMKALANKARVTMSNTGKIAINENARKVYSEEVKSIKEKLDNALTNAPKEREAQRRANVEVAAKKKAYSDANNGEKMKPGDIKKASQQALTKYRASVNSISRRNRSIIFTDKEWEAIQAGAISENRLNQILNNADAKELRARCTPKSSNTLRSSQISKAQHMANSNYTLEQIAKSLGVSTSTVSAYLKGGK